MNDIPPRRGRPPLNRDGNENEGASELNSNRPAMRDDDPRTRAAKRAAELRENRDESYDGTDEYYIDQSVIPDGWSYEWKRKFVLNQEDISHTMALKRSGWEEVPTSRHPEMMAVGSQEPFIIRKGMVLMERPLEITVEARAKLQREARDAVRGKEEQLNAAAPGQFERQNKSDSLVKVKKSYESIPIPD
jgi:hypothetical protein